MILDYNFILIKFQFLLVRLKADLANDIINDLVKFQFLLVRLKVRRRCCL